MEAEIVNIVPILVGVVSKVTALLIIVAALCFGLQRASAAVRHFIWAVGIAGALALPMLSIILPVWHVPLSYGLFGQPLITANNVASKPPDNLSLHPGPIPSSSNWPPKVYAPPPLHPSPPRLSPVVERHLRVSLLAFLPVLAAGLWLIGALALFAQLLVGFYRVRIAHLGSSEASQRIKEIAVAVCDQFFVRRRVDVLIGAVNSRIPIPITWGEMRPVIMLPSHAETWTDECLRAALLHEMAHVARKDWAVQIVSQIACALYWFNPLIWLAARQLRRESERASDDCVLRAGVGPAAYAQRLVDVLRTAPMNTASKYRIASVAMAEPSEMTERLKALLARRNNRKQLNRKTAFAFVILFAVIIVPFAAAQFLDLPTAAPIRSLPGGGTIELIGISNVSTPNSQWWGADGRRLPAAPDVGTTFSHFSHSPGSSQYEVFLAAHGLPTGTSFALSNPDASSLETYTSSYAGSHSTYLGALSTLNRSADSMTVRVEVDVPRWLDLAWFKSNLLPASWSGAAGSGGQMSVALSPVSELDGHSVVTVSFSDNKNVDLRVTAIDSHGKFVVSDTEYSIDSGGLQQRTYTFSNLRTRSISELKVQYRIHQYIEFTNLPVRPGGFAFATASVRNQAAAETNTQGPLLDAKVTCASLVAYGERLQQNGQIRDGILYFRQAVSIDPNDPEAQYQLANALYWQRAKTVRTAKRTNVAVVPVPPTSAEQIEAISHLIRAVELEPENTQWRLSLAAYRAIAHGHVAYNLSFTIGPGGIYILTASPVYSSIRTS